MKNFVILMSVLIFGIFLVLVLFILRPAQFRENTGSENHLILPSSYLLPTAVEEITVKQIQRVSEITAVEDLNALAVSRDGETAYLPSFDENIIYVIDLTSDNVKDRISLTLPFAAAIHPNKNSLYVTTGENLLVEFDLVSLRERGRISLSKVPRHLIFDSKDFLFISHELDNLVTVVNTDNNTIVTTVGVGERPRGLAYKNKRVYVSNFAGASVSVISTVSLTEITRIPLQGRPNQILVDPIRDRLYVSDSFNNQILVINTQGNNLTTTTEVAEFPYGMELDSRAENLYITGYSQNTLSIVDLDSLALTRTIQTAPAFQTQAGFNIVKLLEDQRKLYLVNSLNGKVLVYAF